MPLLIPGVPVLERACGCCCSLKTGSVIIGWLGMTVATLSCSLGIYSVYTGESFSAEFMYLAEPDRWTLVVVSFAWAVLNMMLLCGIHRVSRESAKLMLPYLIANLYSLVTILVNAVRYGAISIAYSIGERVLCILVCLLIFVIGGYFWNVLYSFYRKLEEVQSANRKYQQHVNQPYHYYAHSSIGEHGVIEKPQMP